MIALLLLLAASAARAQQYTRAQLQDYLASVYTLTPKQAWTELNDLQVLDMYNNLTFYYDGALLGPTWAPRSRVESHQYAGTTCDCLHIQLPQCRYKGNGLGQCEYWNLTTYMNLDWLETRAAPIPSNSWFEGLTYWGEWGWPLSCRDSSWMKSQIYGWHQHMWLYPTKGLGLWFNVGKTAAAPNKVAWLLKYGSTEGTIGSNKTEIMHYMAKLTCPDYEAANRTWCDVCANPTFPNQCCCHGSGRNLGVQVSNYRAFKQVSNEKALNDVADMYINGMFGEDGRRSQWPVGTYFGYVNLLDDDIFAIQEQQQFLTAQFYREPQHRQVGREFSDPVYAFEILAKWPRSNARSWADFCALDGTAFGTIDVVGSGQLTDYLDRLYLGPQQPGVVAPTSKWVPRPEFAHVFDRFQSEAAVGGLAQKSFAQSQSQAIKEAQHHGRW